MTEPRYGDDVGTPRIHDMVAEDVFERMLVEVQRDATPPRPDDALWDAYVHALDLAVALRRQLWERDHREAT